MSGAAEDYDYGMWGKLTGYNQTPRWGGSAGRWLKYIGFDKKRVPAAYHLGTALTLAAYYPEEFKIWLTIDRLLH